jgi:hypothetical protein
MRNEKSIHIHVGQEEMNDDDDILPQTHDIPIHILITHVAHNSFTQTNDLESKAQKKGKKNEKTRM